MNKFHLIHLIKEGLFQMVVGFKHHRYINIKRGMELMNSSMTKELILGLEVRERV